MKLSPLRLTLAARKPTPLLLAVLLLHVSSTCLAEDIEYPWSGDASLDFSYYQSDFVSRSLSASTDLTRKTNQHETTFEGSLDNELVTLPNTPSGVSRLKYDMNIKWKFYWAQTPYYGYLSPRIRHNDSGFFTSVQGVRIGAGRRILSDDNHFQMSLEAGVGHRYATMSDQTRIQEQLVTLSTKFLWDITHSIAAKFHLTHEQSALEKYRTTSLELKNKLSQEFALKFQITEKRTYPYDISVPNGELITSVGIDYEI